MKTTPLISVVMPVFNGQEYLKEAIDSILEQTYTNFEFIIVNDGSTDASYAIIEEYANIDKRIVHLNNENQGISNSLNHGIKLAKGEYIARMDADDISLADRFMSQVNFMEANHEIGICGTWVDLFGDIGNGEYIRHPAKDEELKVRLLFSVCFVHPSVMIRRKLLTDTGIGYDDKFTSAQDYDLWSRLKNHTKYANIPKTLMRYRVSNTSVSAIANSAKTDKRYKLISSVYRNVLLELGLEITEEDCQRHFKLGLNSRLRGGGYCIASLNSYFESIIIANSQKQLFNAKYLKQYLAEKYAFALIFKVIKTRKFRTSLLSSLFLIGFIKVCKKILFKRIKNHLLKSNCFDR